MHHPHIQDSTYHNLCCTCGGALPGDEENTELSSYYMYSHTLTHSLTHSLTLSLSVCLSVSVHLYFTLPLPYYREMKQSFPNVRIIILDDANTNKRKGARCSSVVRAFAHCVMGRRIDPSCGGPIELFLVPASAPRLV